MHCLTCTRQTLPSLRACYTMKHSPKLSAGLCLLCVFTLHITLPGCSASHKSQDHQKGFVPIFDGKTLKGWEGDSTYWSVENGCLVGEITPATILKRNQFIIWREGLTKDFELTLEYKITKEGNSGINYRSEELKDLPYALKGYQADIDGANRYTGQNYEERARTTLAYRGQKAIVKELPGPAPLQQHIRNNAWTETTVTASLGNPDSLKNLIKTGDWNRVHLIVKANRMLHYVNDVLMSDVTDNDTINRRFSGLLGVQVHVGPPMRVEFRNIRLRQY